MTEELSLAELDERLSLAALKPSSYERTMRAFAAECDRKALSLERVEPDSWRSEPRRMSLSRKSSLEGLFRSEVSSIDPLDREGEAKLARRIEFAHTRLESSLSRSGVAIDDLTSLRSNLDLGNEGGVRPDLPQEIKERWGEWHALRKEMVERNLFLILLNLERYSHTRASRMDLIQEGAAALFRAVDGFDWRRGLLFRTYAVHWLHQAFRSHLYNFGHMVRLPVYLQKAMKHVRAASQRIDTEDPKRIAQETGLGESLVANALTARRGVLSMDLSYSEEGEGGSIADTLADEESLDFGDHYRPEMEEISLDEGLRMALGRLEERERSVIVSRFGLFGERAQTLSELSRSLGVSLERVRQIQIRALQKMKSPSVLRAVDPYLI